MNLFEKHFEMLKRNQEIFEQYKMVENTGIIISDERQKDFLKTGKELLTIKKSEEFREVRSIHYYNIVIKKLEEYSLPEWFVCLKEGVLLEFAIPVFSRVLQMYPMLCGMNNEWQVLYEITQVSQDFWKLKREWKEYLKQFLNEILFKYEQGAFAISIPEEYLYKFKIFIKT